MFALKPMHHALVFLILLSGLCIADDTMMLHSLKNAFSQLCLSLRSMLPVTAMMMLVIAGIIYASGQIMGAETRARANVWATACLTGALIAVLMVVVAPAVLQEIYGDSGEISCDSASPP